MTLSMRDQENIEKGRQQGIKRGIEQGIEQINKLNALLIQNNRYEDLARSINDPIFQQHLMKEYDI